VVGASNREIFILNDKNVIQVYLIELVIIVKISFLHELPLSIYEQLRGIQYSLSYHDER